MNLSPFQKPVFGNAVQKILPVQEVIVLTM
jgi:hypothetical protein